MRFAVLAFAALVAILLAHAGTARAATPPQGAFAYIGNIGDGSLSGVVHRHNFVSGQRSTIDTELDGGDDIAAGDVLGDAFDEIVVGDDDSGRIDIHDTSTGDRTSFGTTIGDTTAYEDPDDDLAVGDTDGDGKDEIVVANTRFGMVIVYSRTGEQLKRLTNIGYDGGDRMVVGDFVLGHGHDEIAVVSDEDEGRVDVYDLDRNKLREAHTGFDGGSDDVAVGDDTGDLADEVVVANDEEGRIDSADFALGKVHNAPSNYDDDDDLGVGDVTGDGRAEVLIANTDEGRVDVIDFFGDDGTFTSEYDGDDELTVGTFGGGDLDADGIPDRVELLGIRDAKGDVVPQWELPKLGASPCRKDVLVDVDYMHNGKSGADEISHAPKPKVLDIVKQSFAEAPVSAVANCPYPDVATEDGIGLHIDPLTAADDRLPYDATLSVPGEFETLKNDHFESVLDPYVHYNVWGSQYKEADEPVTTSGGLANFTADGQDFIITLGGFPSFGSETEQAVDFMHELGHSIGLDHGGDVEVNCKPNYLSVMNYAYTYEGLIDSADKLDVNVDFSRVALPKLQEDALDESRGVDGGPVDTPNGDADVFDTVWYLGGIEQPPVPADGPIDFDDDGNTNETSKVNVNDGPECASAGAVEELTGFNDWRRLERGLVPDAVDGSAPPVELTYERYAELQALRDQARFPDRVRAIQPPKPGFDGTVLGVAMDDRFIYATHQYRTTNPSQSGGNGTLVMLDRNTFEVVARIPVGQAPRAVALNERTNRAYVVNGGKDSYSLSVIDTAARVPIAEIALGQVPIDVAVNTRLNRVYVSNPYQNRVHVIDGATNAALAPIAIDAPYGMAIDEDRNAIQIALTRRPNPGPPVTALGTVIDDGVTAPQVLPRVDLGAGHFEPVDVAVDPAAGRIYMGELGGGVTIKPAVTVLDLATRQQIKQISMPGPVRAIDVNPSAGLVFASGDRGVEVIDTARLEVIRHMDAGLPFAVATRPGTTRQLVTGDFVSGEVRRLAYSSGEPR